MTTREPDPQPDPRRAATAKLALILLATAAVGALVVLHVTGINGSYYHRWPWRQLDAWRVYPPMLLIALPAIVAQWVVGAGRWRPALALPLLVVSCFGLQLWAAGAQREPFDLRHVVAVLNEPLTTSYFGDARYLDEHGGGSIRGWLAAHPGLMQFYNLHSRQKPPGQILYYWAWLQLFADPDDAALAGGIAVGLLASLGVCAVYGFARLVTSDPRAAFLAATWFALMPATTLFFPTFDAVYPIVTCAIAGAWLLALRTGRLRGAIALGGLLAVALFFTYSLLVLGALLIGWAIVEITRDGRAALRRAIISGAVGVATFAAIYLLMWLATGYDTVATFVSALRNQAYLEASFVLPRPYPHTIPTDLLDFFLGSGWISAVALICWLRRRDGRAHAHVVVGLASILVVALTGLLRCETSRVWLFLQPLVMLALGLELVRWNAWARAVVFACLVLLTAAVAQNMELLSPLL